VPIGLENGQTTDLIQTKWKRGKSCPAGNETQFIQPILTELFWTLLGHLDLKFLSYICAPFTISVWQILHWSVLLLSVLWEVAFIHLALWCICYNMSLLLLVTFTQPTNDTAILYHSYRTFMAVRVATAAKPSI
jgi:hypothetical protein